MPIRHYVVLFDIDNTLIDFAACTRSNVEWIGNATLWQEYIELLKQCLDTDRTKVHIGIVTSKLRYYNKKGVNFQNGDVVSGAVIEDEFFISHATIKAVGLGANLGLKRFLNPELIFFTSGQCKIINALNHVKNILKKQLQCKDLLLDKANILLIDDYASTCELAIASGYQSICVAGLVQLDQVNREARVGSLFLKIFEMFNLPIPVKMLEAAGVVSGNDELNDIDEVEEELINYMSGAEEIGINALQAMSLLNKEESEPVPDTKEDTSLLKLELPLNFFTRTKRKSTEHKRQDPELYVFRK